MASGGAHLSKEFFELVKSIGESRSKQEEDKIIVQEVATLKVKMAEKAVPSKKMREYLMRMIYVEMLGHDASFGHIHAVQMANSKSILEKRMGYLAVSLVLNPDHSFMLLLINTIQKDMRSDNVLEVSIALNVVCKLVSSETVPALLPLVVKLLDHKEGLVKKKAVMALHRFHTLDPTSTAPLNSNIRKALCDSNISVMYASLHLLHDLAIAKPAAYKDLIPDFVSILKQVIEHRLPRDYDYHRMPAPWIQLKLLQVLSVLGQSDKGASEGMYEVLHEVIKRADVGINVGYAIVYECVRTITSIYPDQALIEDAALSISRFITSENHNLKYLGVTALASIVQIDPKYAAEHQLVVIECLEDNDETLKRKTLDLLYRSTTPPWHTLPSRSALSPMVRVRYPPSLPFSVLSYPSAFPFSLVQHDQPTGQQHLAPHASRSALCPRAHEPRFSLSPPSSSSHTLPLCASHAMTSSSQNVTVVVDKLIGFLKAATDQYMRADLLSRISQLSEKYAPSNDWFITAMNNTMELAGEQCKPEYAHNVMKLIIDNASGNAGEEDIREFAVDTYLHLLATRKVLPDLLVQVSAWVIGEYGHTSRQSDAVGQLHALMTAMDRTGPDQAITKGWIISAMLKIVARHGSTPAEVLDIVQRYQNSQQVDLQQRAHEFVELVKTPQLLAHVMPADQASLEVSVDVSLTFLDSYVQAALQAGAKPYQPRSEFGLTERKEDGGHGLKFTAYAPAPHTQHGGAHGGAQAQVAPSPYANTDPHAPANMFGPPGAANGGGHGAEVSTTGLQVKERKWGPKGFNDGQKAAQEAAAAAQLANSPYGGPPQQQQQQQGGGGNYPQSHGGPGGGHDYGGQQQQPDYGHAPPPQQQQQGGFGGARQRPPPQPTEKEKLANSLFAGLGAGGAAGGAGGFKRPGAPTAGPPGQPRLGGAHMAASPQHAPPQQHPQPPRQVDLLGGLVPEPAQPKPVAAGGFGGPTAALDLLAGSPSPPPGGGGGPLDLLAAAGNGSGGDVNAPMYGLSTAPPAIQGQLASMAKSHPMDVMVLSDARVHVSYIKAYGGESTSIAVFISNKTQTPINNVTVPLSIPPGLSGNFTGEPTPTARPGAAPGTHNVLYGVLGGGQTVALLMNLSVRELTFLQQPQLAVGGQLQVAGGACAAHLLHPAWS